MGTNLPARKGRAPSAKSLNIQRAAMLGLAHKCSEETEMDTPRLLFWGFGALCKSCSGSGGILFYLPTEYTRLLLLFGSST